MTGEDPLIGAAVPNPTYLGNRLSYSDAGTNFDPLSNAAYQAALRARFLATVIAWLLGSSALFLFFGIAGLVQRAREAVTFEEVSSGVDLLVIYYVLSSVWSVVLALLFWFRRLSAQLTEWMLTVDGRGSRARSALEHMYSVISARHTPVHSFGVVRLSTERQKPRDYLRLDDDVFTGFVSSFGYGSDLYIGWTFWLNMSPARWLARSLSRMVRAKGSGIYASLLYDQPKAMREVMHSAVRQGVDMATGETTPVGQGSIGASVIVNAVAL